MSTLAAAYAETGDYENAAKWSQKSVELAQKEVDEAKKAVDAAKEDDDRKKLQAEAAKMQTDHDQLKKELDSYHQHKPVRERQTAADAPDARRRRPADSRAPAADQRLLTARTRASENGSAIVLKSI